MLRRAAGAPRNPWLVALNAPVAPRAQLICLPFGGGSSSAFRAWAALFPAHVQLSAVDLPGRAARFAEPALTAIDQVIAGLGSLPDFSLPTVLFGHSLGALLAYEWLSHLYESGRQLPVHLVVSGRGPPQTPRTRAPIHHLPDAEFLTEVRRYQGMPDAVLQHQELVELMLPILRADFTITERYQHRPRGALPVSMLILGGEHDPMVDVTQLHAWRSLSAHASQVETFPGGHFYLDQHCAAIVGRLLSLLPP
jgi:medium-chain acyl-[acyl-carrier-protein] hydrolase